MGSTKIEWADKVWNPVTGCTKVSPGCQNCYAERMAMRFTGHFNVTCHPDRLDQPLHWKKPRRIFVCSMGDLFHEDVPFEFIDRVFSHTWPVPQHKFLILTKRPSRMKKYFDQWQDNNRKLLGDWANEQVQWSHVWLGVTAENQEQADKRIPILLQIPAAKRFVSIEPMLEAVDLTNINIDTPSEIKGHNYKLVNSLEGNFRHDTSFYGKGLDWVIVGAESGAGRRECKIEDVRNVVQQCRAASVPVFVKQLHFQKFSGRGLRLSKKMNEWPKDLQMQEFPT